MALRRKLAVSISAAGGKRTLGEVREHLWKKQNNNKLKG